MPLRSRILIATFLLLLLSSAPRFLAEPDDVPTMADCAPKTCGRGPNISFPFWIDGSHKPSCGHHLFKVTCNNHLPVMTLSGDNYTIHNIAYAHKLFNLSRDSPVIGGGGNCSFPSRNLTLVDDFFQPSDGWFYFLFNCTDTKGQLHNGRNISCATRVGEREIETNYYVGNETEAVEYGRSCNQVVTYPVTAEWSSSRRGYGDFLNQSFGLTWTGLDCGVCESSRGRCGYNASRTATMCICSDRVHAMGCGKADEGNQFTGSEGGHGRNEKIIIWVSSMIGGCFLLICLLYLGLMHIKKKNHSFLGTFLRRISFNDGSLGRELEPLEDQFHAHIFSYKELEEATDGFAASKEIGDGGFGTVYEGKLRDGRVVAVKRLYESNYKRMEQFVNEVSILNRIRHKNLVNLYGCTDYHSCKLLLVYEYIPNGTVADHLYGSRMEQALTWPMRMNIAIETSEALAYLHAVEPPIIHRDIKTSNILLDDHYHVKVADFGLSRSFPPDASYVSTVPQGTPGYLDPDYHRCYRLTDKSDVYSFGVVLAELISSKPAVDISRNMSEINLADMAINKIQSCLLHELVDIMLGFETDQEVRRMMEDVAMLTFKCLQAEKDLRPSMAEVFEILKGITNKGKEHYRVTNAGGEVSEDACLLKASVQNSPDTVHATWNSQSTTSNTSS